MSERHSNCTASARVSVFCLIEFAFGLLQSFEATIRLGLLEPIFEDCEFGPDLAKLFPAAVEGGFRIPVQHLDSLRLQFVKLVLSRFECLPGGVASGPGLCKGFLQLVVVDRLTLLS